MKDFDRAEILRTAQLFHESGDVFELRIPKAGRYKTISGYFNETGVFADAVVGLANEDFPGYYFTINPTQPDLFARSANQYQRFAQITTSDTEILQRRWLPIDLDPVRPSGISSTEEEHAAALELAPKIRSWLIEMGWPENAFVLADSGNGAHLAAKIDLPNDDASRVLVENCLKVLDSKFTSSAVKIDTSTCNAARIWKIYGTMARKGSSTQDRPHRMARIIDAPIPEGLTVVPREKLEDLAAMLPKTEPKASHAQNGNSFDPAKYATDHGATVLRVEPWTDPEGGLWTLAILQKCPFDPSHNRGEARVGVRSDGARTFGCFHNSCQGKGWDDLKALWEPSAKGSPKEEAAILKEIPKLEELTKVIGRKKRINQVTGEPEPDPITGESEEPKLTLSPAKAAAAVCIFLPLRVSSTDTKDAPKLWRYVDGIWRPDGERLIKNLIDSIAGDLSYERGLQETLRRVRGLSDTVTFDSDPFLFPALDGVVDLRTGKFRDPLPEDYLTFRYGTAFNHPEADYRLLLWFLCSSLPDPRDVLTALDIITAIAIRVPFEVIILLFGGGSNGKGVFEKVILALYTLNRATAIRLDEMKRSRFGPGALLNKDVWIVTEVETTKDAMSVLKAEATGELLDVDVKYGDRVQGRPHAIPILDANNAFDFGDNSYGRKRRVVKLDFPNTFGDSDEMRPIDRRLEEKLTRPHVLAGIARIVAARAPSLVKSRKIYRRKSTEEQEDEFRRQQFHLATFFDDCVSTTWPYTAEDPEGKDPKKLKVDEAYAAYLEYCELFNVTTPAERVPFGRYVSERYGVQSVHTSETVGGRKQDYRYYPGIFLVKKAKTVHAEVKLSFYDRYDTPATDIRQIWCRENGTCQDITTDTTDKVLSEVLSEIERMFRFISSCSNKRDITYEKYLETSVVSVVSVVDSQKNAFLNTTDETESVVERDSVVEEPSNSTDEGCPRAEEMHPRKSQPQVDPFTISTFLTKRDHVGLVLASRELRRFSALSLSSKANRTPADALRFLQQAEALGLDVCERVSGEPDQWTWLEEIPATNTEVGPEEAKA
jgi:phage/plasmid-associated DNA primase